MYSVGLEQRDCVEREDLTGLEFAFTRMQELMDRVRLRQRRIPDLGDDRPAVALRLETMRNLIYGLEELRSQTQAQAEKERQSTPSGERPRKTHDMSWSVSLR